MKVYSVYALFGGNIDSEVAYIKEGFFYSAFFFGLIWLLFNKLWFASFLFLLTLNLLLQLVEVHLISPQMFFISLFMLHLTLGFIAKDLLIYRLVKKSYNLADIVLAYSLDEAKYKFIGKVLKINDIGEDDSIPGLKTKS
jgi:hypothetical protein